MSERGNGEVEINNGNDEKEKNKIEEREENRMIIFRSLRRMHQTHLRQDT